MVIVAKFSGLGLFVGGVGFVLVGYLGLPVICIRTLGVGFLLFCI